ncbi:MAG: Na+:solute symporter [Bacteroidales bacterium]|nr:MAG: Na+:solute symporter [Bacteroidales bacterium]
MTELNIIDLIVIVVFFAVIFIIAGYYSRKAGKDTRQFFLSGRNLPWYLAGTAMVATTFAADTPLAVTELVAKNGVAGNWIWWNLAIGGLLTVFFFSRLWRRSGIMTDLEFIEIRYSGTEAALLRGFRAVYLGLFMNAIVIGWVHEAMEKIFRIILPGFDSFLLVAILAIIISVYALASGLLGTVRTDSFQFVFAMAGCIILAVIVIKLPEIKNLKTLSAKLSPEILDFFPKVSNISARQLTGGALALSVGAFLAYVGIQWWSSWYPGADPGGGGYIAQRMLSAKNEKHSLLATLWFNIAHYTIRPWPWIIVALAALVVLPRAQSTDILKEENPVLFEKVEEVYNNKEINKVRDELAGEDPVNEKAFMDFYEKYENTVDPGVMYPKLMARYLPAGLLGLLIAVFMAAYMSTIASQLNWGTSYLINDFYRRFINKSGNETHYVIISRVTIIFLIVFSLLISKYFLTTISGAWIFILNISAGLGAVLILRWYWWRINAWSEISAMIAPIILYPLSRDGISMNLEIFSRVIGFQIKGLGLEPPLTLFPIVIGTTAIWVIITFLTKPVDKNVLVSFFKKVYPGGIGWRKISRNIIGVASGTGFSRLFINWFCGVGAIYSTMYGVGKILFSEYMHGIVALILACSLSVIIYFNLSKNEDK